MIQIGEGMSIPLQIAPLIAIMYSLYISRRSHSIQPSESSPEDVDLNYHVIDFKMLFIQIVIAILKYLHLVRKDIEIPHKDTNVNIIEDDNEVKVRVDIPGVPEEKIKALILENTLYIYASYGKRKYIKIIPITPKVDPKSTRTSYKNGVFEVAIKYDNSDECILIMV